MTSVLPPDSIVLALTATPVPLEAPNLPEEAKLGEGKDDSAVRDDLITDAYNNKTSGQPQVEEGQRQQGELCQRTNHRLPPFLKNDDSC